MYSCGLFDLAPFPESVVLVPCVYAMSFNTGNPIYTPRKIRVVCIGAGFSGIGFAYKLINSQREKGVNLDHLQFVLYEKNADVGGVGPRQTLRVHH